MKFRSLKGTRDVLPAESHRWQYVEQAIRTVMHNFNYREIRTPVFEETALFARGIGELTDIVGKEMYTFTDRSETSVTLKPEMTASVIRSYIQNNLGEQLPLVKVYYLSPMFRQERPQAGRLRQFHQFGAEAIGGQSAAIDAECLALAMEIYRALGVTNMSLKINSVGCERCRPAYRELLQTFLASVREKLSADSQKRFDANPLRILDSKDEGDKTLTAGAPLMKDRLCKECADHFAELRSTLTAQNIPFEIDGRIVRGLDYYTKTAFEIVSTDLGSQDALAGGGRYDLLVEQLGGKPTPSVGFAAGIERLLMVMDEAKLFAGSEPHPFIFIAAADDDGRAWASKAVLELRSAGIASEFDMLGRSLKSQMKEADRQRADYVLVVGAAEIGQNAATLKQMATGDHANVALTHMVAEIKKLSR